VEQRKRRDVGITPLMDEGEAAEHIRLAASGVGVCDDHLEDAFLKEWVRTHANKLACDLCRRTSETPIAADAADVGILVYRGLRRAWGDYIDEIGSWGMGYDGTLATYELLEMQGVTSHGDPLQQLLVGALPDCAWVQRDFFRLPPYERLKTGWDEFVALVKHRNRYFFSLRQADARDLDAMSPLQVLSNLTKTLEQAGLTAVWAAGTRMFRARPHRATESPTNAWELGAVPISLADRAATNRFSAAGIPLFYGASSAGAAEQEARTASRDEPEALTIAEFELRDPLLLVNFAQGVSVPSLFDKWPPTTGFRPGLFAAGGSSGSLVFMPWTGRTGRRVLVTGSTNRSVAGG
jgi:hypothetical protein